MERTKPDFPGGARYRKLGPTLVHRFGAKAFKVTLRGGFGCPNRDGRIGRNGCIFCSEKALLPASGQPFGSLSKQLEAGISAVEKYHRTGNVIAYFQDQTATDAPLETLQNLFGQVISHPRVVALSIGTRPDWIDAKVFEYLSQLSRIKPVWLELGLQSANDSTLKTLRRGHTVLDFQQAVARAHEHGLEVVAHIILDLPGESRTDHAKTAQCINQCKVEGVKIHNLHVLEGTELAKLYRAGQVFLAPLSQYAKMAADFLGMLDSRLVIHRLTGEGPADLMLAPSWGRDKKRIIREIEQVMDSLNLWQGKHQGQI